MIWVWLGLLGLTVWAVRDAGRLFRYRAAHCSCRHVAHHPAARFCAQCGRPIRGAD